MRQHTLGKRVGVGEWAWAVIGWDVQLQGGKHDQESVLASAAERPGLVADRLAAVGDRAEVTLHNKVWRRPSREF